MIESDRPVAAGRNLDYPWDSFDPDDYFRHNYLTLREDDQKILEIVRDFFATTLATAPLPPGARGIDVGTGANLYPALTMLPFCAGITLYEYSQANVSWLKEQHAQEWPSWEAAWCNFWKHLRAQTAYRSIVEPSGELSKRVEVIQGSIFELKDQDAADRWDIGTMFFVAESITGQPNEFLSAVDHFFGVLKPDAPFAVAFMEHSAGYHVGGHQYPATDIDSNDVQKCLGDRAHDVRVHNIGSGDRPLRDGYTGMIVAHGRVSHSN